jgi:hypothetical protein
MTMHKLLEKLETLESQIEKYERLCTEGAQLKANKLKEKLDKVWIAISKDKKAIDEYEERYSVEFDYEV